MHRNTASAKLVALGEEAFACVAFSEEGLVFLAKLIPEFMKMLVMRTMDDMTEPKKLYQQ